MIINEYIYASNGSYISVTVTGRYTAGDTVTATLSGTTYTGTLGADGKCMIPVDATGTYTVTLTTGGATESSTVTVSVLGFTYPVTITSPLFKFSMDFDAEVFASDPTGCLTYTDDLTDKTPVANTNSTLGRVSNYTQSYWHWADDGTSDNPLLNSCFYATFDSNGILHEKLCPNDLTQKIAEWDNVNKVWTTASGTSSITTEDTMFCIPTIYLSSTATSISLSNIPTEGTAYAHTVGGHTYDYLAIGVYANSNYPNSISGATKSIEERSTMRYRIRTRKSVVGGYAMLWNYYQFQLLRMMVLFTIKSFNGQSQLGNGGYGYNSTQGVCDTMAPLAGNISGLYDAMMAYIENMWGYIMLALDDTYFTSEAVYVGQNARPTDDTANKVILPINMSNNGMCITMSTDILTWGIGNGDNSGSTSTGLCDYQYTIPEVNNGLWVGNAGASNKQAGPNYIVSVPTNYTSVKGTRMAFVFDL